MKKINIAIDGYAGCGKSTTARRVAQRLQYVFLDTGSMYRAVTLFFREQQVITEDPEAIKRALQEIFISFHRNEQTGLVETWLNGINVEKRIRQPEISATVSEISAIKAVREEMVAQQRKIGMGRGVVMDGRDIGTVVFPDAELKVFMSASLDARVARRKAELEILGQFPTESDIQANLLHRDFVDTNRKESPLRKAEDARDLDTTSLSIEEQVELVTKWASELIESVNVSSSCGK